MNRYSEDIGVIHTKREARARCDLWLVHIGDFSEVSDFYVFEAINNFIHMVYSHWQFFSSEK